MQGKQISLDFTTEEVNEWILWMKRCLTPGGFEVPGHETCATFAAAAISSADHAHRIARHFPPAFRALVIEAAILHQCWSRQVDLNNSNRLFVSSKRVPLLKATEVVQRYSAREYAVEVSSEQRYRVTFPLPGSEIRFATQLICLEFARQMGLPVRSTAFISLNTSLAARMGVLRQCKSTCRSRELFCNSENLVCCFGVQEIEELDLDEEFKPNLPQSVRTPRYQAGACVFNILALNLIPERACFRNVGGHAEPIFGDFGHCLMGADWTHFLTASARQKPCKTMWDDTVKSYDQLEFWVQRAEGVDINRICELVVKMPAQWYGNDPLMLADVVRKLEDRRGNLRKIIIECVNSGQFARIKKPCTKERRSRWNRLSGSLKVVEG